jgi:hypothetical protein
MLDELQLITTFLDGSVRYYYYDWSGDLTNYYDENESTIYNNFDSLGRSYQVNIVPAAGVIGTTQQIFQYDGLGRLTQALDEISTNNTYNNFYFDSLGRVAEETQSVNTSTYVCTTHSQFFSWVVQQLTYPDGRQTSNSYDLLYRRTNVSESGGSSIATWTFAGPGGKCGIGEWIGMFLHQHRGNQHGGSVQRVQPGLGQFDH